MKVIFAAGGTGGHINPALASAGELRRRHPDADIHFYRYKGAYGIKARTCGGVRL